MPESLFIFKLHLSLGWVDIHINCLRIHLKIDEITRLFIGRDQWLKSLHHCPMKIGMTYKTVVDKEKLTCLTLFGELGTSYIASDFTECGFFIDLYQLLVDVLTLQLHNPLPRIGLRKMKCLNLILNQCELDIRVHQYNPFYFSENIASFCFVRLQELAARRYVEKDILHSYGGTDG